MRAGMGIMARIFVALAAICACDRPLVCESATRASDVQNADRSVEPATFEDIYGPSGASFQAALGFRVFEGDSFQQAAPGFGVAVDDMLVQWREYKLIEDAADCTAGACATVVVDQGQVFEGNTVLGVRILDSSPYGAVAPFDRNDCDGNGLYTDPTDDVDCDNNGVSDVIFLATSVAEPQGERVVANETSAGVYLAQLPISLLADATGVLFAAPPPLTMPYPFSNLANGNAFVKPPVATVTATVTAVVRYEDRWDGSASGQRCLNSPDPASQGFVTAVADITLVAGDLNVVSYRVVELPTATATVFRIPTRALTFTSRSPTEARCH